MPNVSYLESKNTLFVPGNSGTATVKVNSTTGEMIISPASAVILADKDTFTQLTDCCVQNVTYSRTFANANTYYGWCMPCDFVINQDMLEHFYIFKIADVVLTDSGVVNLLLSPKMGVGDIMKANYPYLITSLAANYTYTFNGDNSKGYVLLKAAIETNVNSTPVFSINNGFGTWKFYAVQKRVTKIDFGDTFYYMSSIGAVSKATKDTTAVNSFRWILAYTEP